MLLHECLSLWIKRKRWKCQNCHEYRERVDVKKPIFLKGRSPLQSAIITSKQFSKRQRCCLMSSTKKSSGKRWERRRLVRNSCKDPWKKVIVPSLVSGIWKIDLHPLRSWRGWAESRNLRNIVSSPRVREYSLGMRQSTPKIRLKSGLAECGAFRKTCM